MRGHVPEILLTMEALFTLLLGLHLVLGGQCQSASYPLDLRMSGFNMLAGCGLATSLLAGIYFQDIMKRTQKLQDIKGANFWARNASRGVQHRYLRGAGRFLSDRRRLLYQRH